jgi:adenine/guanine phosphoribosyltransferase-like PRPP-binding protein
VAQPTPIAGLVLVVDHVDLGASGGTHDLSRDLVAAQFGRVADDLAVIDNEHGWQRHAGSDLAS